MVNSITERHPLEPFLPQNARILMLGSFPPPQAKWSMQFFYPNWINDMWRVMGLLFYDDRHHFEVKGEKRFDRERVEEFCVQQGIALYDTAREVVRQKGNASDKFLDIVTPTDIPALLEQIPHCTAIVTTGEKASDIIASTFGCEVPKVGNKTIVRINGKEYNFWRMPSSSRAYPLSLEKKSDFYRQMLQTEIGNI